MATKNFHQVLFDLTNDCSQLQSHAQFFGCAEAAARLQDIRERVERHTFTLAIVGEFRRGKSTLINALLGENILPSDIMPTSATLNRIAYGREPSAKILYKAAPGEKERSEQIKIEDLTHYVTKLTPEAASIAATVKEALVFTPSPFCRIHNIEILDTPGLSDEEALTEITLGVLPQVDAAVLVIMAISPFSETEAAFLDQLLAHHLGRVIFAVTGIDRIHRAADRERVLKSIEQRVEKRVRDFAAQEYAEDPEQQAQFIQRNRPQVFGLSGMLALEGKVANNAEMLEESKFFEFEDELKRFLTLDSDQLALKARASQMEGIAADLVKTAAGRVASLEGQKAAVQNHLAISGALFEALEAACQGEITRLAESEKRLESILRPVKQVMGKNPIPGFLGGLFRTPEETQNELASRLAQIHLFAVTYQRTLQQIRRSVKQLEQQLGQYRLSFSIPPLAPLLAGLAQFNEYAPTPDFWVTRVLPNVLPEFRIDEMRRQIESQNALAYTSALMRYIGGQLQHSLEGIKQAALEIRLLNERSQVFIEHEIQDIRSRSGDLERIQARIAEKYQA